jgi:hypothetical protein
MLSFLDDPNDYDTSEVVQSMDAKIRTIMKLSSRLQGLNNEVPTNTIPEQARSESKTFKTCGMKAKHSKALFFYIRSAL